MPQAITPPMSRGLFDFPHEVLWLSHCKDGPLPRASAKAITTLLDTELRPWDLRWNEDFLDIQRKLREVGATLLGAEAKDISLMTCTSVGLEAVALGFPWEQGDEVLIPVGEFPSNRLPWLALASRGIRCTEVELWPDQSANPAVSPYAGIEPEQRLLEAITPRTRLVSVSWVRFQDGIRLDLEKLGRGCRARGVHLVVDGIQGAGTVMPSLEGVSAFATGGHKGLLGTQGQGLLWTESTFRQLLIPLGTWLSAPEDFSQAGTQAATDALWANDGRRLEAGSPSILACAALATSIQLLIDSGGAAAIQRHVVGLQRQLLAKLAQSPWWAAEAERLSRLVDAGRVGPTLSFRMPDDLAERLLSQGAAKGISASTREGYLRIALHGWHAIEDVERCAAWLCSNR